MAFWIFPYPYNIGLVPLGIGWILKSRTPHHPLLTRIYAAIFQLGLLLVMSAALVPLVSAWAVRTQELHGLAVVFTHLVTYLLKLFGQSVQVIDGGILISTFEDVFPQSLIAAKIFPVPLVLFAGLWSLILLLRGRKVLERLGWFWITIALFAIFRAAILLLLFIQRVNPSYFWDLIPLTLSILPLTLMIRESDLDVIEGSPAVGRQPNYLSVRNGLMLGFMVSGGLIVALTFRDHGTHKAGRILINEHGSDWEWTTEPMDTIIYNEKTTYNYYCMAEYLKHYYQVSANFEPLAQQALQNIDVLILKMPTQPYSAAEINVIIDFVRKGGGLWVIGDHTNVFGSSSFFNSLISHFGYQFNYDSTHDLATGNLSLYRKPAIFAHPTVINLPPYLFATSSSLMAPWNSEAAILGYGLRNDHLDYSQKNFFADRSRKQLNHGFGLLMQQAASYFGKGRLLLYTDSTTFSNFFIFIKGKPELLLNSIDWLNRTNRFRWLNALALLLAVAALVLLIAKKGWNGGTLSGLLLGAALLGFVTDRGAKTAYALPEPTRPVPYLNFERERSNYFLPELRLETDQDKSYLTFYVWTQRLGLVPRAIDSFSQTFNRQEPAIMIDLMKPLSREELDQVKAYLNEGGRLLYLHSSDNAATASVDFLREFGLNITSELAPSDTLNTMTLGGRYFFLRAGGKFTYLTGGKPILKSDQGKTIAAATEVGKGRLIAVSCGQIFRNKSLGQTTVTPDEGLLGLYRTEYRLIGELVKGSLDD